MSIKDIKINRKDSRGFTIVELLVVIVVIGILAAITMVSYANVSTKARTSASQSNAQSIQQFAEAYNADKGYFPESIAAFSAGSTAKKPSNINVISDGTATTSAILSTSSTDGTTIAYSCYLTCTNSTGGRVSYWNYTTGAAVTIYVGAGVSGAANTFVAIT